VNSDLIIALYLLVCGAAAGLYIESYLQRQKQQRESIYAELATQSSRLWKLENPNIHLNDPTEKPATA
jgi:hypothetical protein